MTKRSIGILTISVAIGAGSPVFADTPPPSPIAKVCLDSAGQIETAEIVESSTYPDVDAAALKVARAARFTSGPGKKDGKPSCVKFRVKFVLKDGELVPEGS